MATSKIAVTEGSGKNIASHSISEDAVTKELQRMVPSTSAGAEIAPLTDTQLRATPIPVSGTVAVTNAGITSIDSKTPALGQALAASSVPVVLTAAQITTLTPVSAVTVTNATAANLKAEVVGTGTFAVQSTDSVNSKTILSIMAAYTASQTGATVLTPTSGKKFVITDIVISASAAGTVYLFDHTDSATAKLTPILSLAANGGFSSNFKGLYTATATNNLIKYTSGSGAAGSIMVYYYEV